MSAESTQPIVMRAAYAYNKVMTAQVPTGNSSSRVAIFEPIFAINWIRLQTWGQLCNIGINSSPAKKFPICLWAKPFYSGHSAQPNEAFQGSNNLSQTDIFGKSIFTFYIGQIDFTSNLGSLGMSGSKIMLSQVVSQIAATIKELYGLGGRTFLVLNLAPVGCYPLFLAELPHNSFDLDAFGCVISYNNAVVDYNNMLKEALNQTRQAIPDASLIYVDTHAVLLELFQHPTSHELKYGPRACCGYGDGDYNFDPKVYCGNTKVINGSTLTATAYSDPYNYVSWDGIHALRLQTSLSHMLFSMALTLILHFLFISFVISNL
ncbi:hypothetical protein TEA_019528 [Camellia sinensis var. sinensis]|uniref:GDSL esterase/lipase n=1 Tax=Camellia sinensis var. sinensis TaxID=542762 RepID=A0A4S4F2K5_CAMSN|nr:hypothetical protein TEA_019528 [Camellia sinensis var. sinensis]